MCSNIRAIRSVQRLEVKERRVLRVRVCVCVCVCRKREGQKYASRTRYNTYLCAFAENAARHIPPVCPDLKVKELLVTREDVSLRNAGGRKRGAEGTQSRALTRGIKVSPRATGYDYLRPHPASATHDLKDIRWGYLPAITIVRG